MKNKLVKRLLLLFLFTSVFIGVSAQNHIKYTYDKAGNRIKKEIVLTRSAFSNDSDNIKPFTDRMNERIIQIFPNPTKGNLLITVSGDSENLTTGHLTLFNFAGKMVVKTEITSTTTSLDISSEPNGIYIMQLELGDEKTSWKIIKE